MNKKIIPIIVIVIVGVIVGVVLFMRSGDGTNSNNAVVLNLNTNTAVNENTNADVNENTNSTSAIANDEVKVKGMVFLKGYGSASESYGVLTSAGHEIGTGKYDSMKEQLRAYIGEEINVTFESVCRTTNNDCCRTLFPYCGTVNEWTPVEDSETETVE
jgi:hypothetical protein